MVVKELLRGYRLNGRIARASRVVVGQYAGPSTGTPAEAPPEEKSRRAGERKASGGGEPSLEDIVTRAEAQEALFPGTFDKGKGDDRDDDT